MPKPLLSSPLATDLLERQIALWNALIPRRATKVERVEHGHDRAKGSGYRYLHPTKGWRFVSDRRLGLAPSAANTAGLGLATA